jgi:hypothetical protein
MAPGVMPKLGEPITCDGPCQHKDCEAWRNQAALPCALCGKVIREGDAYFVRKVEHGYVTVQVHHECAENEALDEGAAHRWATS